MSVKRNYLSVDGVFHVVINYCRGCDILLTIILCGLLLREEKT